MSGAAPFIFATLQGQISAWSPTVDGTHALTIVDNSASGAVYTGLAIDTGAGGDMIYAADFVKGSVDVFSGTFAPVTTAGGFVDSTLPAGYAPFGIQQIGDKIYVAYAQPDPTTHEKVGAGLGLVDVFDKQGNLLTHLIPAGGALNAPWGLAMAPANFGKFSNMLLVGNFGDGKVNVYDPATGTLQGTVSTNDGAPIVMPGLWALQFGNGLNGQPTNTLFYTAGPAPGGAWPVRPHRHELTRLAADPGRPPRPGSAASFGRRERPLCARPVDFLRVACFFLRRMI